MTSPYPTKRGKYEKIFKLNIHAMYLIVSAASELNICSLLLATGSLSRFILWLWPYLIHSNVDGRKKGQWWACKCSVLSRFGLMQVLPLYFSAKNENYKTPRYFSSLTLSWPPPKGKYSYTRTWGALASLTLQISAGRRLNSSVHQHTLSCLL